MSIIEKIRSYVEGRKNTAETLQERNICIDIIEVIDYIQEKSEKPINPVLENMQGTTAKASLSTVNPKWPSKLHRAQFAKYPLDHPLCLDNNGNPIYVQEQPVCEGLEEEIERYIPTSLAVKFPTTDIETIKSDIRYIARHFYELGRKSKPKVSEDELYKEIERWINSPEEWDNNIQDIEATARHFAKWGAEHLMK